MTVQRSNKLVKRAQSSESRFTESMAVTEEVSNMLRAVLAGGAVGISIGISIETYEEPDLPGTFRLIVSMRSGREEGRGNE